MKHPSDIALPGFEPRYMTTLVSNTYLVIRSRMCKCRADANDKSTDLMSIVIYV